jgi:glycosyltransferase involved in cell wall biosynthesis
MRSAVSLGQYLAGRTNRLVGTLREKKIRLLLACSGDPWDLPAAALASRLLGVRLGVYLFDWYAYQWTGRTLRWIARRLEPVILRRAVIVLTHSLPLQEQLARRYGIWASYIPNPADEAVLSCPRLVQWPSPADSVTVLFAGAIYAANEDAIQNLVLAMETLRDLPVRLVIFSGQRPAWLVAAAEEGRLSLQSAVPASSVARVLEMADILFLPLTFRSALREVIDTAVPAKMSDYLAMGRPILVHAPGTSFVARYFQVHGCGLVVTENNPATLATAVRDLRGNPDFAVGLGEKARARAEVDFDPQKTRDRFRDALRPHLSRT